jgi:hypothetical protein
MVRLPDGEGAIPVVLVGNKCDVEKGDGQVDQSHLNRFCSEHEFLGWLVSCILYTKVADPQPLCPSPPLRVRFDTSAYSGEGIEEAMRSLVEKILTYPNVFNRKREKQAIFKPEMRSGYKEAGCC